MIELRIMTPSDIPEVAQISIAAEQVCFAGTSTEFIADNNLSIDKHLIIREEKIIGYFKIDSGYFGDYDFCHPDALGLRAFVVSQACQGQGVGKSAIRALKPYLGKLYPSYSTVFLTVNVKNLAARQCYVSAGFKDTGQMYLGGSAGPQHIMCMALS